MTTAERNDRQAEAGIRQRLNALVGKQVELRSKVDPSIIGGIVAGSVTSSSMAAFPINCAARAIGWKPDID